MVAATTMLLLVIITLATAVMGGYLLVGRALRVPYRTATLDVDGTPPAPQGVGLVLRDGTRVPVDLAVYVRTEPDGMAVWQAIVPRGLDLDDIDKLTIAALPPRTRVELYLEIGEHP